MIELLGRDAKFFGKKKKNKKNKREIIVCLFCFLKRLIASETV